MSSQTFTVALAQHAPVFLNLQATLEKAVGLIAAARERDVDVLVFPETWLVGYSSRHALHRKLVPTYTALYGEEGFVIGECDPGRLDEGRMYLDTDGHYSRPDVFRLDVDTSPRANVHGLGEAQE